MKINRHFIKDFPKYKVIGKSYIVKLVKAYKTDNGLFFTAEIVSGDGIGKWTSVNKKELKGVTSDQ